MKHGVDRVLDLCEVGHPFGFKRVGKVGLCVAIFEFFEIKCKAKFLVYKCSRLYLKFMKSGVGSSFWCVSVWGYI